MDASDEHSIAADVSFDGGDLDCGNGLLLLIRKHIDPLNSGQVLEIRSTESSVEEDLPAWCRLTGNELISFTRDGKQRSFLVSKGQFHKRILSRNKEKDDSAASLDVGSKVSKASNASMAEQSVLSLLKQAVPVVIPDSLPSPTEAPPVPTLAVMGIGSWPRPKWMLDSLHGFLEGRLTRDELDATADDAIRLALDSQIRAGVNVVSDGEQRRDNYASFVGSLLDNCQLVPLTDLLPLVEHPDEFKEELNSLDVPADKVRHPVVFGKIGRSRSLGSSDMKFLRQLTDLPLKASLPGPYLLSRIMWMECITDEVYESREELSVDIVRVLREEIHDLLAGGVSLVQLDEPVLSEVVFSGAKNRRSFMCGALSESLDARSELEFAVRLVNSVVEGLPSERLGVHICRGNWTPDESVALRGDYMPLLPFLQNVRVGNLFLEFCTDRAGDLSVINELPSDMRVGIGLVNPKDPKVESVEEIVSRASIAIELLGIERVYLTPDCGFATFADSPLSSEIIARKKLENLVQARNKLLG